MVVNKFLPVLSAHCFYNLNYSQAIKSALENPRLKLTSEGISNLIRWNKGDPFLLTALLLCIGLLALSSVNQANAEPSITLSPIKGAPGSMVTVSGSGFANNTKATILFDGKYLLDSITDDEGAFTKKISIPADAEQGYHRIVGSDGKNSIDALFAVTEPPSITLSLHKAEVEDLVTVSGSNFSLNEKITIKFDDLTLSTTNLLSSSDGKFSTTIRIPKTSGGTHVVYATDGILTASEVIEIREPQSISLSKTFGAAGEIVAIRGKAFTPNSPITIKFDSTLNTIQNITTDPSGSFLAEIRIPLGVAQGSNFISVIDGSGRTASALFDITASGIISLTPTKGYVGTSVDISGAGFSPNSVVSIQLGSIVLDSQATTTSSGTFRGTFRIPAGIGASTYSIDVKDESGIIGTASFSVMSPDPPTLSKRAAIAGSNIKISGSDLSPESDLTIKFDSKTLPVTARTNSNGNFEATVTIPDDANTGEHEISVIDSFGRTSSTFFQVADTLSITPSMGPAETEVTITGAQFAPSSKIQIKFDDVNIGTLPSDLVSSLSGKFITKIRIPANTTEGTYTISAQDMNGRIAVADFEVTEDGLYIVTSQTSTRAGKVVIRGYGFPPYSPIKIMFDDQVVLTTPLKINSTRSGTFSATFDVPGNAPNGNYTITAVGNDVTATSTLNLKRQYIDDRYGILISVVPEKYEFALGETLMISGKVLALNNNFPLILKIINPNDSACSFQQLTIDEEMNFEAQPVRLDGKLCSVEGEYKITAFYGKGKALTKFRIGSAEELSGGKAEVINANLMKDNFRYDNKYTVDLDWATNAVLLRSNVNQTMTFYLMFIEYDANEITKKLSYTEVTLEPFEKDYVIAPYVPRIVNGEPDGYLHVFAWTSMDSPSPLHPGLYVPY